VPALLRVLTVGPVVGRLTGRSIGLLTVREGPAHFVPLADPLRCRGGQDPHRPYVHARRGPQRSCSRWRGTRFWARSSSAPTEAS
jgi:hypothetical protein